MTPIRVQMGGMNAGLTRAFENDGAGAVPEQHTGTTIGPVDEARDGFSANHEGARCASRTNKAIGDPESIDKPGAHGLYIKGGTAMDAEARLQQTRGRREDAIRCGGRYNDQIDVGRLAAGGIDGGTRGVFGKITGRFVGSGNMALADARAIADPFVAGFDHAFELGIGHDPLGQITPGATDACESHSASLPARYFSRC